MTHLQVFNFGGSSYLDDDSKSPIVLSVRFRGDIRDIFTGLYFLRMIGVVRAMSILTKYSPAGKIADFNGLYPLTKK